MNKYQEEYNLIEKLVGDKIYFSNHANFEEVKEVTKTLNSLQEAIDKANKYDDKETPKKFKKILDYSVVCPSCGHHLDKILGRNYDYCPTCGQKLDWSDE